jgi:plasmid stabilization system protein ParE
VRTLSYTDEARLDLARAALLRIQELPFASPPWSYAPQFRARTLRRLRYRIIYEVTDPEIRIVAIAHTSRDPEHWLIRAK